MKINSRELNNNEFFCCTQKDVKNIFDTNDIKVNFAYFHRDFQLNSTTKKLKIKGKIIVSLTISNTYGQIGAEGGQNKAYLNFYVLKNTEYVEKLKKNFLEKVLPKIYEAFLKYKDGNPGLINGVYYLHVELYDGKFIIHEGIEN